MVYISIHFSSSADGIQRKPSESMQDYIDELLDQYDQVRTYSSSLDVSVIKILV